MAWKIVQHDNYMADDDVDPVLILDDEGNEVACNTSFYPTAITKEHAETIVSAVNREPAYHKVVAALRSLLSIAEHFNMAEGYCCCGASMENHDDPLWCGHTPVDAGEYYGGQVVQEAREALALVKAEGAQ